MDDQPTILIVANDPTHSRPLTDALEIAGFTPVVFSTGGTAIRQLESHKPLVAIIDLHLPDIDGLDVLEAIKRRSSGTQCIVLAGRDSKSSAIEAVDRGAYSYLRKPYDTEQLLLAIHRALERREAKLALRELEDKYRELVENASEAVCTHDLEGNLISINQAAARLYGYTREELLRLNVAQILAPEYLSTVRSEVGARSSTTPTTTPREFLTRGKDGNPIWLEVSSRLVTRNNQPAVVECFARDITERKRTEEELQRGVERLQRTLEQTVHALAAAAEARDPYTAGHQKRVADLATSVAAAMGLGDHQTRGIRLAGLIHDVGKIQVPADILSKPARLTKTEWNLVKTHAQAGHDILESIEFPWPVAQIVLEHHERIDGSGYPRGLTYEETLPEARIMAVADVVEAMASHRPYRPAYSLERALHEISHNKGSLYAPDAVDACLAVVAERGAKLGLT